MNPADRGDERSGRAKFARVRRCTHVTYSALHEGVEIKRCKTFVPEGRGECMECRTPEPHSFHYPEARA